MRISADNPYPVAPLTTSQGRCSASSSLAVAPAWAAAELRALSIHFDDNCCRDHYPGFPLPSLATIVAWSSPSSPNEDPPPSP